MYGRHNNYDTLTRQLGAGTTLAAQEPKTSSHMEKPVAQEGRTNIVLAVQEEQMKLVETEAQKMQRVLGPASTPPRSVKRGFLAALGLR
jgi:hypothetical protein